MRNDCKRILILTWTWPLLLLLLSCGTEIGNGWKADDGVSNDERKTAGAAPEASNDNASPTDTEGGDSDGFDEDDLVVGENNDKEPANESPVFEDSNYESDLLLAECATPFADALAQEDYVLDVSSTKSDYLVQWEDDLWAFFTDVESETPYRYIQVNETTSGSLILAADGETEKKTGIECADRVDIATAAIDGEYSYRSTTVVLTLASGKVRELSWFVHKGSNRLVRIEIHSDDLDPATINVSAPSD